MFSQPRAIHCKSLLTMSKSLYHLALASPWFLDVPVVVSNLLCAVATFGTSELLNHVILSRRELYAPFAIVAIEAIVP